jgi:hypothetical protein
VFEGGGILFLCTSIPIPDVLEAGAKTTKNYMHPQLLLELDEGIASRPELAPLTKQAAYTPAEAHSGLPNALQGIEELVELVQAVGSSVWLKLLLEIVVDALGSLESMSLTLSSARGSGACEG